MNDELKPCPFCGSSAELIRQGWEIIIECGGCGNRTRGHLGGYALRMEKHAKSKAIAAWNKRQEEKDA